MKSLASILLVCTALGIPAHARAGNSAQSPTTEAPERLGAVKFSTSCSSSLQPSLDRGIALLHDFWYEEAKHQFERLAQTEPACAMAYWGEAMSDFHQIWNRPDSKAMAYGWSAVQKAQAQKPKTDREREYISALSAFYSPGNQTYQTRVEAYSAAMAALHNSYPDDIDATAFYALSLLAEESPDDTSLANKRKALAILVPVFAKNPDHPGLAHYIIHACDTPSLARQGLAAAERYGEIAPSAAHAAHMPAHIFARLGMWQPDIDSNLASIAASQRALKKGQGAAFDQLHADDFLIYAFLQSGQDARAENTLDNAMSLLTHLDAMPHMAAHGMAAMLPYYRVKFPAFYYLETQDWNAAANLELMPKAPAEARSLAYWAHTVAAGHLRQRQKAQTNLTMYETVLQEMRSGEEAFVANSTPMRIEHSEVLAWNAFAQDKEAEALTHMREAADLQDKVGQGEVDIPAREMLAGMLLDFHHPQQASIEFDRALKLSPNRFNGLFNAGRAAEAVGDKDKTESYYSALLKSTGNGSQSKRPEFAHVQGYLSSTRIAAK